MVIKKEARRAQSLELLVHGNKPALERDCRAFVFTTLLQFAVLFSESNPCVVWEVCWFFSF